MVLETISKIPLMTPSILLLIIHNHFQKISFSHIGCKGGARTFGASSHSILRPCVVFIDSENLLGRKGYNVSPASLNNLRKIFAFFFFYMGMCHLLH